MGVPPVSAQPSCAVLKDFTTDRHEFSRILRLCCRRFFGGETQVAGSTSSEHSRDGYATALRRREC